MKLLFILNESSPGLHVDVYSSLSSLKVQGIISDYTVFPFIYYLNKYNLSTVHQMIISSFEELNPDIMILSHTGGLKNIKDTIVKLKKIKPHLAIGYRDGDIYHWYYKPLPKEVKELLKVCNVAFWCGYDDIIHNLKKNFIRDLRYIPLTTDPIRFPYSKDRDTEYDLVIVGNIIRSRIPFKTFVGSKERLELGKYFFKKLGKRFKVFGSGWDNVPYYGGSIDFSKQKDVYSSSRFVLGTNNINAQYYFSNRLPISLSIGRIMIHNHEKGIELPFKEIGYSYFYKDKSSAWQILQDLLNKNESEISKLEVSISKYSLDKITMECSIKYMIEVLQSYVSKSVHTKVPTDVTNPWLSGILLEPYKG